jgi:hypothetical protein
MENRFSVFEPAFQIRKKLFPWGGSGATATAGGAVRQTLRSRFSWWKPGVFPTYKNSTRQQYTLALKTHLIPQFGRYKLREITNADVQAFMGKLLETRA